jgi:HTH-type transcriptional regulator/antitoxin HigA
MIRSSQQLAITKRKRDEARALAAECDSDESNVYDEFAAELDVEIREYEAINAGYSKSFEVKEADDIGECLVKARIARHWTQAQLADALGIAEQQVQRYESDDYQRMSLWRVSEVFDALGYRIRGCVEPSQEEAGGITVDPSSMMARYQSSPESGTNSARSKTLVVGTT